MAKPKTFISKATDAAIDTVSTILRSAFRIFGIVLAVLLLTGMLFSCIFAYYVKTCLTPDLDVSLDDYRLDQSSTIWYSDSSGEWHELVTLTGIHNRVWADYENLPGARTADQATEISNEIRNRMQGSNFNYMELATIAIEDKRFYDHKGVDWYRTSGAFVEMFATMQNSYGGSTITQQLIKNLTGQDEITVQRKLTEIFGALEIEKKYDKQELMEWYLNAVYFGEGCYGVQTAAQMYFGKDVSELSLAECAAIVGITNKPTYYDPFYNEENNKTRQETILREMYNQGFISYETYKRAVAEQLVFARSPEEEYTQALYSFYEEQVVDDVIRDLMTLKGISESAARQLVFNGGYQIYSCIDTTIQAYVDSVYQDLNQIPDGGGAQQLQSAIVIMNPYDGSVVALSGGVGEKEINFGLNRAAGTRRSPGSAFKPIASYGPAVELGYITPATLVNDASYITLSGTSWYPQNDSKTNIGIVTIFDALTYSLNTVAAQIVDKLTPEVCYNYLTTKLGVRSLVPDDCAYAPMALGQLTNGITVREMAAAYCSFVNDGVFTESRTYSLVTDKDGNVVINNSPSQNQAFSPNTAHVMTYMLENAVENGTGTEATLYNMPVAGKTGTSTEYYDRWFVGCTPYYVAAVWTGFDTPAKVNASGNPAARLWRSVMKPVHDSLEYRSFTYPYLGENTGIFGITGTNGLDGGGADSIFLPEGDIFGNSPYTGGNVTQPGIFVDDGGTFGGGSYGGNDGPGTIVIFG